jgi:hypothetical protein
MSHESKKPPCTFFLTTNSTNYTNKLILFFFNIRAIRVICCCNLWDVGWVLKKTTKINPVNLRLSASYSGGGDGI